MNLNLKNTNIEIILKSSLVIIAILIISRIIININTKYNKKDKSIYIVNQSVKIIRMLLIGLTILYFYKDNINNVFAVVGITSASIALSLKDVLLNLFSGFYIKSNKPFKVEDRIEIDDTKGDVISLNLCSFNLLEVGENDQSTGIIVEIPNSFIFSKKVKNYTKAIKYVWSEIYVKIDLDNDLPKCKSILYSIVNKNEIVKSIPKKMESQLKNAMKDYRIYYNHLEPIIYTSVINDYIVLSIRFLIHPKNKRFVESQIWNQIIVEFKKENIKLRG